MLALAIAQAFAVSAQAQDAMPDSQTTPPAQELPKVSVRHKAQDDTRPKLQHIMREVEGPLITVTKKTSITQLDNIPTVVDNNLRALFAQTPGLLVSEQITASQFNLSYRGIGNPQESEYVSVMQDGIPLEGDWIGFPTLYVLPLPQTISQVQLIRGGSSLLYGPEPAPVVNFISRLPDPDREFGGYSENIVGSHGLFGTFNEVDGTVGQWDYLADAHYRSSDGQRANSGSILKGADFHVGYRPDDDGYWALDVHGYQMTAGDAGRYGYPVFQADANFTPTPYNHDGVDRYVLALSNQQKFGKHVQLVSKLWVGYQHQDTTSAAGLNFANPINYPGSTTRQDAAFHFVGMDSRIVDRWGSGNALTAGIVYYHSNAPFYQYNDANLWAQHSDRFATVCATPTSVDCVKLAQQRSTDYGALFAENVFRLPDEWHIVPSVRIDREHVAIDESVHVRNPANPLPLVNRSVTHTVPLFGLGLGNDFGHANETYFNVSQGWRPVRYYDIGSPFGNLLTTPQNDPDPTHVLSYEAGVHGTPVNGLFYDASVFWVNVKNRIEAIQAPNQPNGNTIDINTGSTRSRGFEGQIDYDFLAARDPHTVRHFSVFANLSLLNARFVSSALGYTGNVPAFSPRHLARVGFTYREDKKLKLALSATSVASHYWQDSNLPFATPGTLTYIPAKVPQYTIADFSADYWLLPQVRLLGGVSNLFDRKYYDRVFSNGIEPGPRRTYYIGAAYQF
ncbi:MAG: TonB-dependent receptor [Rhodanobacter sp.]|jgi:Fe(3+) dicitrate transport protein|nr:TonB-dependent receptor [Rhodanobacter sp.]